MKKFLYFTPLLALMATSCKKESASSGGGSSGYADYSSLASGSVSGDQKVNVKPGDKLSCIFTVTDSANPPPFKRCMSVIMNSEDSGVVKDL
jgi:hypothetical protein